MQIGRNVTVVRLASGAVVIHSTAKFTAADKRRIEELGNPQWLVEATKFHDSFSEDGRAAFPELTYLVPEGFPKADKLNAQPLDAPAAWREELQVRRLDGMPAVQEHVVFHAPSRTLIVADLVFNFGEDAPRWTKFLARHFMRLPNLSGMSLAFRLMIRDKTAFLRSIAEVMRWDFDRVIVGHGEIIETGGKERIRLVLERFGLIRSAARD
jgi:glyoxylase-like metal-dependent hydrolase (beta-lactamase superfamily II)